MSSVHQLIYVSAARRPLSDDQLKGLLVGSRKRNHAAGISGLLVYDRGSFLQIIEGDADPVHAVYSRIEADARHHRLTILFEGTNSRRSFPDWSMGYVSLSAEGARQVEGYNDFFLQHREADSAPAPDLARRLIEAFAQGRWHTYVE